MAKGRKSAPKSAAAKGGSVGRGEARGGSKPIKVRAIETGYYGLIVRQPGDVFVIANDREFSKVWMERVDKAVPEKVSSAQDALNVDTHRLRMEKAGTAPLPDTGGGASPLD